MQRSSTSHGLLFVLLACLLPSRCSAWDFGNGGADWTADGLCGGQGKASAQSPIDLPAHAPAGKEEDMLFFKYPAMGNPLPVYNNGYSIAATLPESYKGGFGFGKTLANMGDDNAAAYRLWQINFHSPSEHTVNGERAALELQMVHQRVTGSEELAIVSILFTEKSGASNNFLSIIDKAGIPQKAWDEVNVNTDGTPSTDPNWHPDPASNTLDFSSMLNGSAYFHYTGSLTVPPCETNVKYFVRQSAMVAGQDQIDSFRSVLKATCPPNGNYRESPPTTTAGHGLHLVGSVDPFNGQKVYMPSVVGAAHHDIFDDIPEWVMDYIKNSPKTTMLEATDPDALREAKEHYNSARLNVDSAGAAKSDAERKLVTTQGLYEKTKGYVEKMNYKWKVIQAQNFLNSMTLLLEQADKAWDMDIKKLALAILGAHASDPEAHPLNAPSEGEAPEEIDYNPRINLPRGYAASPFFPGNSAETTVRIGVGAGMSDTIPSKLAPSLKQADGPAGEASVPGVKSTTAAPHASLAQGKANLRSNQGHVLKGASERKIGVHEPLI